MYKKVCSILSRGTEKGGNSEGYMWVGSEINSQEYIIAPVPHDIQSLDDFVQGSLRCGTKNDVNLISFCRFALMSNILLQSNKAILDDKKVKVAIIGAGAVGIAACYEFFRFGFKNVSIVYKEKHLNRVSLLSSAINRVCLDKFNPKDYGIIVDATGNSNAILNIVQNSLPRTKIFLLGVPFDNPNIGLLDFYRKNLILIGCHELRISSQERQALFSQLLDDYSVSNINFSDYVDCHYYNEEKRKELLNKDLDKPINIFKCR